MPTHAYFGRQSCLICRLNFILKSKQAVAIKSSYRLDKSEQQQQKKNQHESFPVRKAAVACEMGKPGWEQRLDLSSREKKENSSFDCCPLTSSDTVIGAFMIHQMKAMSVSSQHLGHTAHSNEINKPAAEGRQRSARWETNGSSGAKRDKRGGRGGLQILLLNRRRLRLPQSCPCFAAYSWSRSANQPAVVGTGQLDGGWCPLTFWLVKLWPWAC